MYALLILYLLGTIAEIESTAYDRNLYSFARHPYAFYHQVRYSSPKTAQQVSKQHHGKHHYKKTAPEVSKQILSDADALKLIRIMLPKIYRTLQQISSERQTLERNLAKHGRVINLNTRRSDISRLRNFRADPQIHAMETAQWPFDDVSDRLIRLSGNYTYPRDFINDKMPNIDIRHLLPGCGKDIERCLERIPTARCNANSRYRRIDGQCNNLQNPRWGSAMNCQPRLLPANYVGTSGFRRSRNGGSLPNPRTLSLNLHYNRNRPTNNWTHMYMFFGQLLDHDITFTPQTTTGDNAAIECCPPQRETHPQCAPIIVRSDDPFYSRFRQTCINFVRSAICPTCHLGDNAAIECCPPQRETHPQCAPIIVRSDDPFYSRFRQTCINFVRSAICPTCHLGPRQFMNEVTSTIDASFVYGNSEEEVRRLRLYDGTGRLRSTRSRRYPYEELLPQTSDPENDQCSASERNELCFQAGDSRVNQHTVLTSLQTIFHREHNRIAGGLRRQNPHWDDERLFQETRRILGAQMQAITYNEYLPITLGDWYMSHYKLRAGEWTRYDPSVDPTTRLEFTTAAFRFGHSMINSIVANRPLNASNGRRLLRNEFFQPFDLYRGYLGPLVEGASNSPAQWFDRHLVEDVTNFLYRQRGNSTGLDLASININRGRDHGLPTYVETVRWCFPYKIVRNYRDLLKHGLMRHEEVYRLRQIYSSVEDIDLWPGILSEIRPDTAVISNTGACIIGWQFNRLKYGDRFYFEHAHQAGSFRYRQLEELRKVTLSQIICLNTNISQMRWNAMRFGSRNNPYIDCRHVRGINLSYWREHYRRMKN